jgi:formylglycine-generating enzyme required for sulfatase activity
VTGGGRHFWLDKYVVTAGRMRAFLERVGGNVRDAVRNDPKWVSAWTDSMPTNMDEARAQLGPTAQSWEWPQAGTPDFPRDLWAARGCQVNGGGSRTYWQPTIDGDSNRYSQEVLDEKTLNCVTPQLLLAFCIWDGKDLPDPEELTFAWTGGNANRLYPWGNAPVPSETDFAPSDYLVHVYGYMYPAYSAPDASYNVGAPGRKPAGDGPFGHSDLAGNVYQFAHRGATTYRLDNGSWERHEIGLRGSYIPHETFRRYYAMGGRCARR